MTYRDDFYIKENIIGYTGDLNNYPTVYFKIVDVGGTTFGRITQDHPKQNNIGRNKVRTKQDYEIYNDDRKAHEYYDGKIKHNSRNEFIPVDNADFQTLSILAESINKFPDQKPK